ncbi:MAG: flavin reductase family protein [Chromatiales bacterium]|nr:MAG: flavin reductase family protein [Chromatiales bacterium]
MNGPSAAERALRDALGQFATGVTVVTTVTASGEPAGITVNSFTSLSLTPPLVLWNLSRKSANWEAFQDVEHFAVNVLAADQEPMALAFAHPGGDPFAGLEVEKGLGGVPLLPGVLAQFECEVRNRYQGGDHEMLIGEVFDYREFDGEPLLFYRGNFGRFRHHTRPWKA